MSFFRFAWAMILISLLGMLNSLPAQLAPGTLYHADFTRGDQGWTFETLPQFFKEPVGAATSEGLTVASQGFAGEFGSWASPSPLFSGDSTGILYLRWKLRKHDADSRIAPIFRLRVSSVDFEQTYMYQVDPRRGDGLQAPRGDSMTYDWLVQPIIRTGLSTQFRVVFDLVTHDASMTTSPYILEEFQVVRIPLNQFGLVIVPFNWSFDFGQVQGWTPRAWGGSVHSPVLSPAVNALRIQSTGAPGMGTWNSPVLTPGGVSSVRRAFFPVMLRDMTVAQASKRPEFRFRINTLDFQVSVLAVYPSVREDQSLIIPGVYGTCYLYLKDNPASAGDDQMYLSFDMTHFNRQDEPIGSINLDAASMGTLAMPFVP